MPSGAVRAGRHTHAVLSVRTGQVGHALPGEHVLGTRAVDGDLEEVLVVARAVDGDAGQVVGRALDAVEVEPFEPAASGWSEL